MNKLFDEILSLKDERTHRSALRIQSILNDNPELFTSTFGPDLYRDFSSGFDLIAGSRAGYFGTEQFKSDFGKQIESLSYYLNRISP